MPPTLASLVHHSALKLAVRAGGDRLDVPVRWAHVSELADPVPYMEGGELLLITALKLDAEDPEAMRRYVRRLAGAGVVGLGFAVGVNYEEIPKALVDAAEEEGLPLLEVPRRTPFLAISKEVSAAIAADQYRAVTAGFAAQRELTRQALTEGPEGLLTALASQVHGWAALYDASGAVVAAAPEWAGRRAARLTADVERLRERPVAGLGGGRRARALRPRRPRRTALPGHRPPPAGRPRGRHRVGPGHGGALRRPLGDRPADPDHGTLPLPPGGGAAHRRGGAAHAAGGRTGPRARRRRMSCTAACWTPRSGYWWPSRLSARGHADASPHARVPGTADQAEDPVGALAEVMESAAARSGETVLVVPEGERLVALAADEGAAATAVTAYAAALEDARASGAEDEEDELIVGLSGPAGPIAAAAAYKQAEQALSVARRRGRVLVEHEQLAAGSVLPLLADDAVKAFADGLLRALHEHDATGRGDLVASLRAWLSRHGQWDAAAADLGVHRHTLRYRMRRVEEILGRSLDDPDVRMELWLALKATAPD